LFAVFILILDVGYMVIHLCDTLYPCLCTFIC